MAEGVRTVKRVLFVTYLLVIHAALIYLAGEKVVTHYISITPPTEITDPTASAPVPTPSEVPQEFVVTTNENANVQIEMPSGPGLIVPVSGVKPEQLSDTFSDSRSEGRFHDAIDIPAPAGTPVLAAADGEIIRLFDSERGGTTIYQRTTDGRFVFYYAHLAQRAEGIHVGRRVLRGETIAYVGDSGNAGLGNYHLHFSVAQITDPNRPWEGKFLNPYPLLRYGLYPE